jgi:hypothetical protein
MKSRFKVLSLATAVLFATSCSKDDNNDSIVDAGQQQTQQQEDVVVKEKCITVTGKATNQAGLSKFDIASPANDKRAISFSEKDEIHIVYTGEKEINVTGSFTNASTGEFSLTISFPAQREIEEEVVDENGNKVTQKKMVDNGFDYLDGAPLSLTIGNASDDAVQCFTSKEDMLKAIYETASTELSATKGDDGTYTLNSLGVIQFAPQVAIIENQKGGEIHIKDTDKNTKVALTEYAVVKIGTTIQFIETVPDGLGGSKEELIERNDGSVFFTVDKARYITLK